MKPVKFSKLERRVGRSASRRARLQLMQVPWDRFHRAYEEYIDWQAFSLWTRAIVESEGCAPSQLKAILRKRCPGFMEKAARSDKPELLGLQLLSWIHDQTFGFARMEKWLDALVFYGFRDTRSQGYWAYWEHCEVEGKKWQPDSYPAFVQWKRSALRCKLHGNVSYATVAKAVEKFIDFEAFVYWLRPLCRGTKAPLPPHVALELRQESPRLLEFMERDTMEAYGDESKSWQRLFHWGEDHVLQPAKRDGWLDCALGQVRTHPLHVRMVDYAAFCCKSGLGDTPLAYPSLRQWQKQVQAHVTVSRR